MLSEQGPDLRGAASRRVAEALQSPDRLAALERSALLDAPPEEAFDRVTRLAALQVGAPVALVSIVDDHRQFFKSAVGLEEPWASRRETPLTHSFCQHVVADGQPLIVDDARVHPLVRDNQAIEDLGVIAYCGVPLLDGDGRILGAVCAIDGEPREWLPEDLTVLVDLAEILRTELRLRRALLRADEREANRQEMLAVLAHDLRGPLGVVSGMAQLMLERADDLSADDVRSFLDSMDRQARQAADLVDRLLTVEGRIPAPVPVPLDLQDEARGVANAKREASGANVVHDPGPPVPAVLDPTMVRQVLGNLVDNALHHGGPGVTVRLRARAIDDEVLVEVQDDGPGIEPDVAANVFDRLVSRAGSSGHGLGLHIVRRLAHAMGGEVGLRSEPGRGTTFGVRLPATPGGAQIR